MKVGRIMSKAGRQFQHLSPAILTWLGVGGVVATTILAVKATPKALDVIEKEYNSRWEMNVDVGDFKKPGPLSKFDIVRVAWPCYIPATLVGVSTIFCIVGANVLNKKQQASIASIYAMADQSYRQYRKAAEEVYGEDANSKIMAQVAKDMYADSGGYKVYSPDLDSDSDKVLFYDSYASRYFTSTLASVINAQYHLNRNWQLRGVASVNEFYHFLGIDKIKGGDDIGWGYDLAEGGLAWVDFDISKTEMEDGLECLIVTSVYPPEALDIDQDYPRDSYQR